MSEGESFTFEAKAPAGPDFSRARPVTGLYFLPEEALPPKKWRQRHPWLFRLLFLLLCVGLFSLGLGAAGFMQGGASLSGSGLAVARIEGMILEAGPVVDWLDKLRRDGKVRGVLLRINSPGGAVAPSQEIHAAVKRLAEAKPVLVSMGAAAASGAYYIAVAAPYIMANPSSVTGSIGVRMDLLNAQGLTDLIGVKPQSLSSGPLKEAGSPYRPLRRDEREYLQGLVRDMYEVFVQEVAAGRRLDLDKAEALADGRAYTGRQALELGLVDELGDYGAALNKLAAMSGLQETPPYETLPAGPPSTQSRLLKLLGAVLPGLDLSARAPSFPVFYY